MANSDENAAATVDTWLHAIEQKFDSNASKASALINNNDQLQAHFTKMVEAFVQLVHKTESLCPKKNAEKSQAKLGEIKIDSNEKNNSSALILTGQCRCLMLENVELRRQINLARLEMEALRLTVRYLDRERAGRVQQLQLASKLIDGSIYNSDVQQLSPTELYSVWCHLESEITLHRSKAFIARCLLEINRQNFVNKFTATRNNVTQQRQQNLPPIGQIRRVPIAAKKSSSELGLGLVGGRVHSLPVLIAVVAEESPLYGRVFSGDAIISANGVDLSKSTLPEAADAISKRGAGENKPAGEIVVRYIGYEQIMLTGEFSSSNNPFDSEDLIAGEVEFMKSISNQQQHAWKNDDDCAFYPVELPVVTRLMKFADLSSFTFLKLPSCFPVKNGDEEDNFDELNPFSEKFDLIERDDGRNISTSKQTRLTTKGQPVQPTTNNNGSTSNSSSAFSADGVFQ